MAPRVAVTADRRREEQAVLLERAGAEPLMFPLVRTSPEDAATVLAATEKMCVHPPAYLVANTGYGMRAWFGLARERGLLEQLVGALRCKTAVAARGPKALGELRKVGLDAFYKAPGETLDEVAKRLLEEDLAGRQVVVQLHGDEPGRSWQGLEAAGARLSYLRVYKVAGADEATAHALAREIAEGRVEAVTFTAAPQVQALFSVAGSERLLKALNGGGVVVACIGPVCAEAARACGVEAPLVAPHPRLGSLVSALADRLGISPKSPSSS